MPDYIIPKIGQITLENGDLVCRIPEMHDGAGYEFGRFYVSVAGLTYTGELTLVQRADPPKLRFAAWYPPEAPRGCVGGITWNALRPDESGVQEELVMALGSKAEDIKTATDYRGQVALYVRGRGDDEPRLAAIISDAYRAGVAKVRTYVRAIYAGLWKWS